ncbi:hypothetical protein [Roseovarius sp. MBR-79]
MLDWFTKVYSPDIRSSCYRTSLYASASEALLFFVEKPNPTEAGKLIDGFAALYFCGFFAWNSEMVAQTSGMASFYLRAVWLNSILWGVDYFQEIRISSP